MPPSGTPSTTTFAPRSACARSVVACRLSGRAQSEPRYATLVRWLQISAACSSRRTHHATVDSKRAGVAAAADATTRAITEPKLPPPTMATRSGASGTVEAIDCCGPIVPSTATRR